MRRLLVTKRNVRSDDELRACDGVWSAVRSAVQTAGGRAWRFRYPDRPLLLVEFIEWTEAADPLGDAAVKAGLAALNGIAASTNELLEEVT